MKENLKNKDIFLSSKKKEEHKTWYVKDRVWTVIRKEGDILEMLK